jgi:hypothetical protein
VANLGIRVAATQYWIDFDEDDFRDFQAEYTTDFTGDKLSG